MSRAFVFPGQGSQVLGMGMELKESFPAAKLVFEEVDDALGQSLSKLIAQGPVSDLTLTENTQPALMAVSVAASRVLEYEGGFKLADKGAFVAGHSLGEYSALVAAGSLTLADAARLLRKRGLAMQAAVPVGEGAMAALLGLDLEAAQEIAAEAAQGQVCSAANDNAPGQVVVSGHAAAVDRAIAIAAGRGAKRSIKLDVSAPFHCQLMQRAADAMREALAEITLKKPAPTLIANITAAPVDDPEAIRQLLVEQVTGLVRWRESVTAMKEAGVDRVVELGAGKVLSGLVRRIDRDIAVDNAGTPAEIETVLKGF